MRRTCLVLMAVFLASSCVQSTLAPSTTPAEGAAVAPPGGWLDWCRRHTSDVRCREPDADDRKAQPE